MIYLSFGKRGKKGICLNTSIILIICETPYWQAVYLGQRMIKVFCVNAASCDIKAR